MFKGVGMRTPRKRAEQIGTVPAGFADGIAYVPSAGVPATDKQKGEYHDRAMAAEPKVGPHGLDAKPFAVKGA
jgi:hypothetical protein